MALALRTATQDWKALYDIHAETLVANQRFLGNCYRAANWIDVNLTTGRGSQDREHKTWLVSKTYPALSVTH